MNQYVVKVEHLPEGIFGKRTDKIRVFAIDEDSAIRFVYKTQLFTQTSIIQSVKLATRTKKYDK